MGSDELLSEKYPNLWALAVGYLGQDYSIHGPELEDAVQAFVDDCSSEVVDETKQEIQNFLLSFQNDLDLQFEQLTCGQHSRETGTNAHDYLTWLLKCLAR